MDWKQKPISDRDRKPQSHLPPRTRGDTICTFMARKRAALTPNLLFSKLRRGSRMKYGAVLLLIFTCLLPDAVQAHSFEVPYVLPIPLWIYTYACMALLVVSFAAMGYFFATPVAAAVPV